MGFNDIFFYYLWMTTRNFFDVITKNNKNVYVVLDYTFTIEHKYPFNFTIKLF